MNAMSMPGFTADTALYKTNGHYQPGRHAIYSPGSAIIPAIPRCENCEDILERCENNGWRTHGVQRMRSRRLLRRTADA